MTAPRSRWNAGPKVPVNTGLRPRSGTLMLISLLCALALPTVILSVGLEADGFAQTITDAAAILFAILLVIAWGVRQRGGAGGGFVAMVLRAALATSVLMGASFGVLWLWDDSRGPGADFVGGDFLIVLGAWAIITFVVVSLLLSAVRKAASRRG